MKGLLCELHPLSEAELGTVAQWLGGTECEELLRGTSSTLIRHDRYAAVEADGRRAALVTDTRGTVVGLMHWWRLGEGVYEVGGATGEQRLWGTGIGIEAAALLVDYLFDVMNCRRVEFTSGIHNDATMSLALSDNLSFEAVCRDYFQTSRGAVPAVKSGLTREEYARPYPHYQPRVGRRLDSGRLAEHALAMARRIDIREIADRVSGEGR
ncbi:GNAT family N-acetyltransferase [Streptomyces natalensis]|uniref:GNAT family N-acetyltransferase n=1 Tax=Streptomyces natalensis TaxID=68242 RepID=UPI0004AAF9E1|nr:GNAT family protein [Streptomyces natalensis]